MSRALSIFSCSLAISLGLLMLATNGAQARICKSTIEIGRGDAVAKSKAQSVARENWSVRVLDRYGPSWAVWALAVGQKQSCANLPRHWTCSAQAQPCSY